MIDERITIAGQIAPDGQPAQGRDGVPSNVARVAEAFEEPVELVDLGERVLAHNRVSGTGREASAASSNSASSRRSKGGRAVRVENYTYREDALAAAGMPK